MDICKKMSYIINLKPNKRNEEKTFFYAAVALSSLLAFNANQQHQESLLAVNPLVKENVEALTQGVLLPEVVITCSSGNEGQCFVKGNDLKMCGEYMYYQCEYSGYQMYTCYNPC